MLSARNKIRGTVSEVKTEGVMGIVKAKAGDDTITALISAASVRDLRLREGSRVVAVIKATEVMLANDYQKLSARNQLKGIVSAVESDSVMSIVKLDVSETIGITALISSEAVRQLGITVGSQAVAVIKSTSVMIAAD